GRIGSQAPMPGLILQGSIHFPRCVTPAHTSIDDVAWRHILVIREGHRCRVLWTKIVVDILVYVAQTPAPAFRDAAICRNFETTCSRIANVCRLRENPACRVGTTPVAVDIA